MIKPHTRGHHAWNHRPSTLAESSPPVEISLDSPVSALYTPHRSSPTVWRTIASSSREVTSRDPIHPVA